jgi:hypothetical protein
MPVVNTTQARIEMSAKQVQAFIDLIHDIAAEPDQIPPMVYIEETNLASTLVVGGKDMKMHLIDHWGQSWPLPS